MLFNSLPFLIFFPIVVFVYFVLPLKYRNYWLLVASYYFYMGWNAKYALLLFFSTIVTFFSGILLSKFDGRDKIKKKRAIVAVSLILNLGILFFFKYANFVMESIEAVLYRIGITFAPYRLDLLLPVGISFYIFQALSYTMDVYREAIPAEKNFFRYALFVSFFPQLVAGPIERSTHLLPQFQEVHVFNPDRVTRGLQMMLWGYFEKIAIADSIAPIVDNIYGNWENQSGSQIVAATILFAIQIYCDFGGYSHIATGAAEVLGFRLMQNFRQPYFAVNVRDFWRRWHLSLSTWFRDYLYIPLGGNRVGIWRQRLNIMIVFLISGLWHGANWTFVVWGGLNGAFQIIPHPQITNMGTNRIQKYLLKGLCIIGTFILIDFTWLFFRAENISHAILLIQQSLQFPGNWNPWVLMGTLGIDRLTMCGIGLFVCLLLVVDILHELGISVRKKISATPLLVRWSIIVIACELVIIQAVVQYGRPVTEFLYFQF